MDSEQFEIGEKKESYAPHHANIKQHVLWSGVLRILKILFALLASLGIGFLIYWLCSFINLHYNFNFNYTVCLAISMVISNGIYNKIIHKNSNYSTTNNSDISFNRITNAVANALEETFSSFIGFFILFFIAIRIAVYYKYHWVITKFVVKIFHIKRTDVSTDVLVDILNCMQTNGPIHIVIIVILLLILLYMAIAMLYRLITRKKAKCPNCGTECKQRLLFTKFKCKKCGNKFYTLEQQKEK